jgi:hypothetical protein
LHAFIISPMHNKLKVGVIFLRFKASDYRVTVNYARTMMWK